MDINLDDCRFRSDPDNTLSQRHHTQDGVDGNICLYPPPDREQTEIKLY